MTTATMAVAVIYVRDGGSSDGSYSGHGGGVEIRVVAVAAMVMVLVVAAEMMVLAVVARD